MSVDQLVDELLKLLIPALPYLIKGVKIGGKKVAEKLGELGAGQSFEYANKVWLKLKRGKPSRKFSLATKELAKTPRDKAWKKMMADELKAALKADPNLAKNLKLILSWDIPEQSVRAVRNKNSRISQHVETTGRQRVVVNENDGLVIHQSIGKKT